MAIGNKALLDANEAAQTHGQETAAEGASLADIARAQVAAATPNKTMLARAYARDRMSTRKKVIIFAIILATLTIISLAQSTINPGQFYNPADMIGCYASWFRLNVMGFFDKTIALEQASIIRQYPMYWQVLARVFYTFVTLICGALLAMAGMLYQNVFRNPIAAPTMLGVSSGVSLGCVVMVSLLGYEAASETMYCWRLVYSLIGGLIVLALVLGLGKLASGRKTLNIINVMLVATVISGLLNSVINYMVNNLFSSDLWTAYYKITNATEMYSSWQAAAIITVTAAITCIPIYLNRFRLNAIAFSDSDMRLMGVNATGMRILALVCGSLMILVAQTFVGDVAMISLVVPFISRAVFGAEFRRQAVGNVLIGATLVMICRIIVSAIPFVAGETIPMSTAVSVVMLPLFVWVMVAVQTQWNKQ